MTPPRWKVWLSTAAGADYRAIIDWTNQRFGEGQAVAYAEILSAALADLEDGPAILGVKSRADIARGLLSLHVARHGRRGRHVVLFRVLGWPPHGAIEVLRILHDSMDPIRHLPHGLQEDAV